MIMKRVNKALHEHFDYRDPVTLRTIAEASDDEQNQLLSALTSKLYDQIVSKVDDIDFGSIPRSRGDITKIENYPQLTECLSILRSIIEQSKEDPRPVDIVFTAVENLKSRTKTFSKAFAIGVELPVLTYNTVALAVVSSVSFLIASCIEYIKTPGADTFDIALDHVAYNKTKENLLFENLSLFNSGCQNGQIDIAVNEAIRGFRVHEAAEPEEGSITTVIIKTPDGEDKEVQVKSDDLNRIMIQDQPDVPTTEPDDIVKEEGDYKVVSGTLAILGCILPFIRGLVYFFFHTSQKVSDYFAIQAEFIEMNAFRVQNNSNLEPDRRKQVYDRQMKIARAFKNVSNAFAIKFSKAKKNSANDIAADKKKYKVEEFPEITPATTTAGSVLF